MIPLVSVLIPISRYDTYTLPSIESIICQTLNEIEIIIICNGPDSANILRRIGSGISDARVRYLQTPIKGLANALNFGINASKADLIARHDADDLSLKDRLKIQYEFMQHNHDVGVLGCKVKLIDGNGNQLNAGFPYVAKHHHIKMASPIINLLCHPALMFRKQALLDVGGYVYGYRCEDHDLFLRLFESTNWKAYNINQTLFFYRRHANQLTGKVDFSLFAEASAPLALRFLKTGNPMFVLGILYVFPPITILKRVLRRAVNLLPR